MQHNVGNAFELARHRTKVAKEDLETAHDDYAKRHLRAANNRAYYSIKTADRNCRNVA